MKRYSTLEVDRSGDIARIALARPEQRNAIDRTMCDELAAVAKELETDRSAKVVVLTGKGSVFTVGGDIGYFLEKKASLGGELLGMATAFHNAVQSFQRMAAPLLVAVNGTAAGGGFSLVCGADMAIAKRSAKLVSAYTRSGLTPDGGGTWFLPRLVGRQRAFDLMATNRALSADEAAALGLVSRVVDDARFEAEVDEVARQLASLPVGAVHGLKRLLDASADHSLAEQLADEATSIAAVGSSADTLDKLDAFFRKG